MKLDLSKDKEKIRRYILKRIKNYRSYVNDGPGENQIHRSKRFTLSLCSSLPLHRHRPYILSREHVLDKLQDNKRMDRIGLS